MVIRDVKVQTFALISNDDTKDGMSIYDKLKVLQRLTGVLFDGYNLDNMHEFNRVKELVDKIFLKVIQFHTVYADFSTLFTHHGNRGITMGIHMSCDICKRGVALLFIVQELQELLHCFECGREDKFKTRLRKLERQMQEQRK